MVKEIKYTGFTASPSDYECPDGDLAAVLNVVPEEGSLSPILPPRQLFQLTDGRILHFIHEPSASTRNYITSRSTTSTVFEYTTDGSEYHPFFSLPLSTDVYQINAVGNVLVILTSQGMQYFLWKGYSDGYLSLGTNMPELSISFGLQGKSFQGTIHKRNRVGGESFSGNLSYDTLENLTEQLYADLNKSLRSDWAEGEYYERINDIVDSFAFPFFVRYAYRLYDGTLVMHSSPIFMPISTDGPKCFFLNYNDRSYDSNDLYYCLHYIYCSLDYCIKQDVKEKLQQWGDIIKSVDIFVSNPIYTIDQEGKFMNDLVFRRYNDEHDTYRASYTACKYTTLSETENRYQFVDNAEVFDRLVGYGISFLDGTNIKKVEDTPKYGIDFPRKKEKDLKLEMESVKNFYLLCSIDINDLKTERTIIPIEHKYLLSLGEKEAMTDDYNSHDMIIPQISYGYNGRLNIANLRSNLYQGYDTDSMFPHTDGCKISTGFTQYVESFDTSSDYRIVVQFTFFIRQDNKEIVVQNDSALFGSNHRFLYLYYPNVHAYKAVMCVYPEGSPSEKKYYEVTLSNHPNLNGSYYFSTFDDIINREANISAAPPSPSSDRTIDIPNKIYTSSVNNPFYFPVLGINTVGTGKIFSICAAAKALSQGQFGQFPLYAFSTEGVWALEVKKVSGTNIDGEPGLYEAKQPITRDVCINSDSITQLDSSVLFATDRGLMIISGSTSICISDNLDYSQAFQISSLAHSDKLLSLVGFTPADLGYVSFHEFIRGCRMLYSYVRQHIIVFNHDYPYAYVYSLKSKSWGMMPSTIALTIPSYPEAIAQLADGSIVDYSSVADPTEAITGIKGLLVTRPIKLDLPDALKTVDTVIQRGNFQRGHVKSAIYGSRDLTNWFIVWTSADHFLRGFRGTPYKYYRIALLCELDPTESIYGCSVQYTPRFADRLR